MHKNYSRFKTKGKGQYLPQEIGVNDVFSQSPVSFYVNFCHAFRPSQKGTSEIHVLTRKSPCMSARAIPPAPHNCPGLRGEGGKGRVPCPGRAGEEGVPSPDQGEGREGCPVLAGGGGEGGVPVLAGGGGGGVPCPGQGEGGGEGENEGLRNEGEGAVPCPGWGRGGRGTLSWLGEGRRRAP